MSDNPWAAPGQEPPPPGPQPPPPPGQQPPAPGASQQPPPAPPPWGAVDFQPGIVPLRRLGLGDIYSGVMRLIRGNPGATVGMALVVTLAVTVPLTALAAVLTATLAPALSEDGISGEAGIADLLTNLPSLGQLVIGLLLPLFIAWVTHQAVLGRKVGMGETWQGTKDRVLPGLGALLLAAVLYLLPLTLIGGLFAGVVLAAISVGGGGGVALGIAGGGLLLLVWVIVALYLWTRLAFVFPALTVERLGPVAAIRRSWRLTGGRRFWPVLGIRLLTSVLIGVVGAIISLPLGLIAGVAQVVLAGDGNAGYVVLAVANGLALIISAALTTPITAGVDALLYIGQRMEHEGYDIELIRQTGGRPGGQTG
ncbi:glycerophosphoryl diester phosphodiesterase membrane domain-containing protein [Janibacter sp. GS2]|uniref:glycerophosphoryl diester phosphodiesterase membrane domain-containing protein n=1 Tax=Janibacter sp. GS2 TaxID=3442646 RepID=UPI003EBCC41E